MQLLEPRLPSRRGSVRLTDLMSFGAAFITNSRGPTPVGQVDDTDLPVDGDAIQRVISAYEAVPWDPI
jgi:hypothetical protein